MDQISKTSPTESAQPIPIGYATPAAAESGATSREWFKALDNGLILLLIVSGFQIVTGYCRAKQWISEGTALAVQIAGSAGIVAALWWLTKADPASMWTRARSALRWTIRISAILQVFWAPLIALIASVGPARVRFDLMVFFVCPILVGVVSCTTWSYLRLIARRFGWKQLEASAAVAVWAWGIAALLAVPFASMFTMMLGVWVWLPPNMQPLLGDQSKLAEQLFFLGEKLTLLVFGVSWHVGTAWASFILTAGSLMLLIAFYRVIRRARSAPN